MYYNPFMEAFMDNCKEIQCRIESFEHGNLSLKNEEAFTNHILNCADCREEMEIYYIISYGLDDDNEIDKVLLHFTKKNIK